MLIVIDNHGQMCNRMWALSPFIALAKEYNKSIYILNFQEYKDDYQFANSNGLVKFKFLGSNLINRVVKKLIRKGIGNKWLFTVLGIKHITKDTGVQQIHNYLSGGNTLIIDTWNAEKDNVILYKHNQFVKDLFTPVAKYKDRIDDIFNHLRQNNKVIVGVHIRRGDYKNWKEGKYYYDDQAYAGMLKQIQEQVPDKDVIFYICSNEEIQGAGYNGISYYTSPKSHPVEDLYALSKCDYIIGPPSTFSMWASFQGNVPIYFIQDANTPVNLKSFSPIIHQNYKEDGSGLWL
jgi:hypothetical protein